MNFFSCVGRRTVLLNSRQLLVMPVSNTYLQYVNGVIKRP